jgi:two-component system, OmpR family, response regulator ResD
MEKQYHILVVDDEDRIRRLLRMYLEREGYLIDEAENGEIALEMAFSTDYDLILLDLMLPGMDGLDVCGEIRKKKATPIIMLTARGEEANRVEGFEAGTDDYVVKPFSPRELVHRVKAVLRRASATAFLTTDTETHNVLVFPELTIDHDAHEVKAGGKKIRPKNTSCCTTWPNPQTKCSHGNNCSAMCGIMNFLGI